MYIIFSYYDVSLLQTLTVTSELVIVLERQTDFFQNTSLVIPLNEELTSRNASGNFTAYCYQQSFKFVLIKQDITNNILYINMFSPLLIHFQLVRRDQLTLKNDTFSVLQHFIRPTCLSNCKVFLFTFCN